ncbi:homoserine dehydrogenase [Luteimonas wenzhouensis]|uniref:Homoserine dehydrogenase n=1 Tax=Luteimonas wenzhouensis TaxID=2599615 RepID=A0A5C5U5Q3_9GAMM|nr:homoserine dehydrogenase [Luteimonas wenzhouensis]NLW95948.1 homoserine dehydrogenase [Xanthomonadaceae bacterium]TWT20902.1 homoserine dehydrogenase [Luteimonas wenzhouensis]
MSKVTRIRTPAAGTRGGRIALLGTGVVGSAVVARYRQLAERGVALPPFAWLSNSRVQVANEGSLESAIATAHAAPRRTGTVPPWAEGEALARGDIVIDATASDTVAGWHPEWLARGIHVVTANKLGAGGDLTRAQAIVDAQREGGRYGDSATVGAGLPLLRLLRELVAGGDRIHAVEGMLSGSLGWLLSRFDDTRPFSDLVREARDAGYTEPDPRVDLSGEDVRRKLLILARASGAMLEARDVRVSSLVPDALRDAAPDEVDARLAALDAPLRERFLTAYRSDARLCFVARFDAGRGASVALRALPLSNPLVSGHGTENRAAIFSDRYREQPLVVQGPGAGAEVTAAALLDDVLRIARAAPHA